MLNPDILVDAIRDKLRLIPAFVVMMTASDRINSYTETAATSLDHFLGLPLPSTLIVWQGLEEVSEGQAAWTHTISIYIRCSARMGAILHTIINGVPTDGSLRIFDADTVDPRWELLGIPTATRSVADEEVEFLELTVRYRQKVED